MTGAEQTRADALGEAASALDHHALLLNDDYEAAPWLRAADLIRCLVPQRHTILGPDVLAQNGITEEQMGLIDDLLAHPGWSVARHLAWMYEQQQMKQSNYPEGVTHEPPR